MLLIDNTLWLIIGKNLAFAKLEKITIIKDWRL